MKYFLDIVPKPRMTRSDKWKKRPIVQKYWEYKDEVRRQGIKYENGQDIIYYVQMPKSWSKKKKKLMNGKPHTNRPDIDNYQKALFDALFTEDSHIWHVGIQKKIWSRESAIEISDML